MIARWFVFYARRRTGTNNVFWESFPGRIGPGQAWTGCWRKLILLAWQNVRKAGAVRDQFARRNFGKIELVEELICSHESALHVYKNLYEIGARMDISRSSVWHIAKHDLGLKIYETDGATLFSKVVSNKLRGNASNEITLICAKIHVHDSLLWLWESVDPPSMFQISYV